MSNSPKDEGPKKVYTLPNDVSFERLDHPFGVEEVMRQVKDPSTDPGSAEAPIKKVIHDVYEPDDFKPVDPIGHDDMLKYATPYKGPDFYADVVQEVLGQAGRLTAKVEAALKSLRTDGFTKENFEPIKAALEKALPEIPEPEAT